ncbi:DUF1211 domain-containing protein, partial [Listeria monocytogenes]|nr:DUF1211 domain-containing protein [Listeria monocytogenes]
APQISTILFIIFPIAGWIIQLTNRRQPPK